MNYVELHFTEKQGFVYAQNPDAKAIVSIMGKIDLDVDEFVTFYHLYDLLPDLHFLGYKVFVRPEGTSITQSRELKIQNKEPT